MAILPLYAHERGDIDGRGRGSLMKLIRRRILEARHGILGSSGGVVAFVSVLVFLALLMTLVVSWVASFASESGGDVVQSSEPRVQEGVAGIPAASGKGVASLDRESEPSEPGAARDAYRRARVVAAFEHAWLGYKKYAFGHDEIRPTTNATNDSWGGFGAVLVDGLDTMMLMGLEDDVAAARQHIEGLSFRKDYSASFFETTIRYLGGLLSAYDLSRDELYLRKASELGECLLAAFASPSGLPYHEVNLLTGAAKNPSWSADRAVLSEIGSFQLEFLHLATLTGDTRFSDAVERVNELIASGNSIQGLFPVYVDIKTGAFSGDHLSTGALADSFYEYLLKQVLLSRGRDRSSLRLYTEAVEGIRALLVGRSGPRGLTFLGQREGGRTTPQFDHLMCFVPGMLALGTTVPGIESHEHLALAQELAHTCVTLYTDQPTGLGPELVDFATDPQAPADYTVRSGAYLLRPETLESLFVLHRLTGDEAYKDQAWAIFTAIERHCRTASAYSGLRDVTQRDGEQNNSMQSFFLAETLKYLFLIFSEPDVLPLDEWVLSTEAHPLRIATKRA